MFYFDSAKIKRLPNYLLILCLVVALATSCTNREEELIKLKADAEKGRTTAQYSLARMYHKGNKIPKNYEKAMKWYQIVANKGNYRAQYFVGNMYFRGHGVEKNYKEAKRIMERALKSDNVDGIHHEHYGDILYRLGDVDEAVEQWSKAKGLNSASELIDKKIADRKLHE